MINLVERFLTIYEASIYILIYFTVTITNHSQVENSFSGALSSHKSTLKFTDLIFYLLSVSHQWYPEFHLQKMTHYAQGPIFSAHCGLWLFWQCHNYWFIHFFRDVTWLVNVIYVYGGYGTVGPELLSFLQWCHLFRVLSHLSGLWWLSHPLKALSLHLHHSSHPVGFLWCHCIVL